MCSKFLHGEGIKQTLGIVFSRLFWAQEMEVAFTHPLHLEE